MHLGGPVADLTKADDKSVFHLFFLTRLPLTVILLGMANKL